MPLQNKKVLLTRRPQGAVKSTDFSIVTEALPQLQEGELLVKNEFVSLDPAMRGWMNEGTTYIRGVELGAVMRAFAAGHVVESKHPLFKAGDAVQGLLGVQRYSVTTGNGLFPIHASEAPLSWHLGLLGMPGLTAYFGLLDKGKPQAGETVVVSGAAGMVGSVVGQIARIKGCRVIGIAGGEEKCRYLTEELSFDAAIDYKKESVSKTLKAAAPDGLHIYFDNVGGEILDAALMNLAMGARVVICGAISQYNDAQFSGLKNYVRIVTARGLLTGIIVLDYFGKAGEAFTDLWTWYQEGKLKYREHVIEGLDRFAEALNMLFTGENRGKLVLKVD